MSELLDIQTITKICELVERESGIHLDLSKEYLLKTRLAPFIKKHKFGTQIDFTTQILANPKYLHEVVELLTTNETYWFRDDRLWSILQQQLIPDLLDDLIHNRRRNVSIWSSACSTGQEPYSIGMSIMNEIDKRGISKDYYRLFRILATDLSDNNLHHAQKGIYSSAQMQRGTTEDHMTYFKSTHNNCHQIHPELGQIIEFRKLNLLSPFHYELDKFDLVFCRNVLIYFKEDMKNEILKKIHNTMESDAFLILGSTEAILQDQLFTFEPRYKNICYKKRLNT